jgi:hypothetical protein
VSGFECNEKAPLFSRFSKRHLCSLCGAKSGIQIGDMPTNKRKLRLYSRRPELNGVGLGALATALALAALLPTYPALKSAGLITVGFLAAISVVFFLKGAFKKVPAIDEEEKWNAIVDKLRNDTDSFLRLAGRYWEVVSEGHPNARADWRNYVAYVPIPSVTEGPLSSWGATLKNHPSEDVQIFFEFCSAVARPLEAQEYRRYAVRTYDWLYRARESKAGFDKWMEEQEVASGGEELVVILAYMEIARAFDNPIGKTATHLGFWALAEEWHPNTLHD